MEAMRYVVEGQGESRWLFSCEGLIDGDRMLTHGGSVAHALRID